MWRYDRYEFKHGVYKMKHFVYITTNLISGKKYIGKHSTSNIDDGYLGSGILIKKAISSYGKENFKREILCMFDTAKEVEVLAFKNRKNKCWAYLDQIKSIWLENERPGYRKLRRLAIEAGLPDENYEFVIKHFKRNQSNG